MSPVYRILALLTLSVPLSVAAQTEDWRALNLDLTDNFISPAYHAMALSTRSLGNEAEAFCAAPDADKFNTLQSAYHQSMDDWQGIQHVKFGPITYFNWQYRLQYWPDDKGIGGRQLDVLLAEADTGILDLEVFARQSVGVQGFPALERLLFGEGAMQALSQEDFRCQLMTTISTNLADIASGLDTRWREEFRATVVLEDDSGFFEDMEDASTDFIKALVETVPAINEQKLLAPMGESQAAFRERRAESWRSQRSLRNVRLNLIALQNYFLAEQDNVSVEHVFSPERAQDVAAAFTVSLTLLEGMPDSLAVQAQTDSGYMQLVALTESLELLYEALEQAVKDTDLYLGFNSLDGD